ncbi:type 1 glutamine amidotransferase [Cryobacterium lyxosi]|uniref:Lipid II isoglutaminyl synthase (glutamine-hydrolyzing) subunit GatD n=1 Tax=Cryobacterium lyxosi TaxID=1259228 RepID=A0A4R8ZFZ8_9MICO|nr:glutamine amidotransferase [Cryobacterium lyxosi]TFD26041.1 glutamine amidotransferase [Cryobacterium lyxosi]
MTATSLDRPFTVVSLLPRLLDTNGDAGNARVLAQRIRWSGHDALVVDVHSRADLPEHVDAVSVGSGTDAALLPVRDALRTLVEELRIWSNSGVPILAVGTGWELLSWGIDRADGTVLEGLGLVAGHAVPRATRVTDDIIVASKYGRLIGFENHARDYVGAEASPLGRVIYGTGNSDPRANGPQIEGLTMGEVFCTHLHGPVLARNPALADHLLQAAFDRFGLRYSRGATSESVDEIARAARNQVAVRLGQSPE